MKCSVRSIASQNICAATPPSMLLKAIRPLRLPSGSCRKRPDCPVPSPAFCAVEPVNCNDVNTSSTHEPRLMVASVVAAWTVTPAVKVRASTKKLSVCRPMSGAEGVAIRLIGELSYDRLNVRRNDELAVTLLGDGTAGDAAQAN